MFSKSQPISRCSGLVGYRDVDVIGVAEVEWTGHRHAEIMEGYAIPEPSQYELNLVHLPYQCER